MPLASVVQYYASNTQAAVDKFKDVMVAAGWTLHDDRTGASSYGYVLTSNGESGNEMTCYAYILKYTTAQNIAFYVYTYWDNSTHVGNCALGYYPYMSQGATTPFYINCSATKDSVLIDTYVSSTHYTTLLCLATPLLDTVGELQSGVSAGSNVVLTLGAGQADAFEVGKIYQIIDGVSRQLATVSAVNSGSDQITVSSLTYSYASGARIGNRPHKWTIYGTRNSFGYLYRVGTSGTSTETTQCQVGESFFSYGYIAPDQRASQKYPMFPLIFYDYSSDGVAGVQNLTQYTTWLRCYINSSKELVLSVGDRSSGTSSGSNTSSTLNDTTKSWSVNAYQDKVLVIHGGTGAGQYRRISNNSTNSLSISENWLTIPDATSGYTVCDEGWLYLYSNNNYNQSGAMRVI